MGYVAVLLSLISEMSEIFNVSIISASVFSGVSLCVSSEGRSVSTVFFSCSVMATEFSSASFSAKLTTPEVSIIETHKKDATIFLYIQNTPSNIYFIYYFHFPFYNGYYILNMEIYHFKQLLRAFNTNIIFKFIRINSQNFYNLLCLCIFLKKQY